MSLIRGNRVRDPRDLRELLARARLYLIFSPSACAGRDPLAVLEAVLDSVDLIQVRPKDPDSGLDPALGRAARLATSSAREVYDWTLRVLDLLQGHPEREIPVIANDRVDVARSLWERGCGGVHLGQDDCPPQVAREVLGTTALIGLSTHAHVQVARSLEEPVDYLGFGPIRATKTKGYGRGVGVEPCLVACRAAHVPVFPIGGIDSTNVAELGDVGRAAVSSAVLGAADPGRAAKEIRELLLAGD